MNSHTHNDILASHRTQGSHNLQRGPRHVFQVVKTAARPTPQWGPAAPENRGGRYALQRRRIDAVSNGVVLELK